ncbi:MAG TPA: peptidylprolyl isomerase [Planctomycetota bacterium]|nr:peptidylprolyl isomerase [Planctomycetota bacterium]
MLRALALTVLLAAQDKSPLLDPQSPAVNLTAPAEFKVKLETSKGDIVLNVVRDWAPKGADRFYSLVKNGYYDDCRFYRVLPKYVAQVGIHGDPKISGKWHEAPIGDDPVKQKNTRGRVTFAKGGPNSRTTNIFINLRDSTSLDPQGFAPIGEVIEGMDVADQLHSGYGDGAPKGRGPSQKRLYEEGNAWLQKDFKDLDLIKTAKIVD